MMGQDIYLGGVFMNISNIDWKVIVPGVGLIGLAIYQFTSGDYSNGVQSVFAALAALGVKVGFDRTQVVLKAQNDQIVAQNDRLLAMQTNKK